METQAGRRAEVPAGWTPCPSESLNHAWTDEKLRIRSLKDEGELRRLSELRIERLQLQTHAIREEVNGKHAIFASEYVRSDGTRGRVGFQPVHAE